MPSNVMDGRRTANVIEIIENNYTYIGADELSPLINISNTLDLQGPMRYISNFDFNGGLSEIFIVYSSELNDNLSLGISYSKMFGVSKYKYSVDLYSLSYTNTGELLETSFSENNYVINTQEYSSSRYLLELRYQFEKMNFILDYSISEPLKIKLNEQVQFTNSIFDDLSFNNLGKMEKYGLGLSYIFSNKLMINCIIYLIMFKIFYRPNINIFNFSYVNWFNFDIHKKISAPLISVALPPSLEGQAAEGGVKSLFLFHLSF